MSTNSADPDLLIGYGRGIDSPITAARNAIPACLLALAHHGAANSRFGVSTTAVTRADDAVAVLDEIAHEVKVTAGAFAAADRSGAGVRVVESDILLGLVSVIADVRVGFDGTLDPDGVIGFHTTGEATAIIGPVTVEADGRVLVGAEVARRVNGPRIENGSLTADVFAKAFVGVRATADATMSLGVIDARGSLITSVGGDVEARGSVSLGRDGLLAKAGIEASLAAKARAEGEVEMGPVKAAGGCEAAAGVGGAIHGEAEISWDRIGVDAGFGLIALVGGGCSGSISISPSGVVDTVGDVWDTGTDIAGDIWDTATDAAGEVWDTAGDLVESAGDLLGERLPWLG